MDILLFFINIPITNAQFFIESPNKIIDKYIYNNEKKKELVKQIKIKLTLF